MDQSGCKLDTLSAQCFYFEGWPARFPVSLFLNDSSVITAHPDHSSLTSELRWEQSVFIRPHDNNTEYDCFIHLVCVHADISAQTLNSAAERQSWCLTHVSQETRTMADYYYYTSCLSESLRHHSPILRHIPRATCVLMVCWEALTNLTCSLHSLSWATFRCVVI